VSSSSSTMRMRAIGPPWDEPDIKAHRKAPRLFLLVPTVPVTLFQDLRRRTEWFVGRSGYSERAPDLVYHRLIRRGHRAAWCFLADTGGALPVGVDIPTGERRARLSVLPPCRFGLALAVAAQDDRLARGRTCRSTSAALGANGASARFRLEVLRFLMRQRSERKACQRRTFQPPHWRSRMGKLLPSFNQLGRRTFIFPHDARRRVLCKELPPLSDSKSGLRRAPARRAVARVCGHAVGATQVLR